MLIMRSRATSRQREYCTQYQESDFDFASRLMEEEGIYYYFKFPERPAQDGDRQHAAVAPRYARDGETHFRGGGGRHARRRAHFPVAQGAELGSGKYTLWDHHFQLPGKNLDSRTDGDEIGAGGET